MKDKTILQIIPEAPKSEIGGLNLPQNQNLLPFSLLASTYYIAEANSKNVQNYFPDNKNILFRPSLVPGSTTISIMNGKHIFHLRIENSFLKQIGDIYQNMVHYNNGQNKFVDGLLTAAQQCVSTGQITDSNFVKLVRENTANMLATIKEAQKLDRETYRM